MGDGVAQQVLKRSADLVEHRAVEFDLAATNFKVGALAEFLRRLPDNPVQPLRLAGERHHAHTHQLLLQLTVHPRLGKDGGVGIVEVLEQVLLHGRDVVDRLGHHPGEFLEAGKAVEFQRVEASMPLIRGGGARLHLRLGLNFNVAQLAAQANHVFREVEQGALEADHFAFNSGTGNRQFASFVNQLVDQVGTHTQHGFLRCGFLAGFTRRAFNDCGCLCCRRRCHYGLYRGVFVCLAGLCRWSFQRLPTLQAFDDLDDAVEGGFDVLDQFKRCAASLVGLLDTSFNGMGNFTQRHGARHASAALQGMKKAMKRAQRLGIIGIGSPVTQILGDRFGKLGSFFEKDWQ